MVEQTIRAEQVEGLEDLIRQQVKAVISEGGPDWQDMEEIRRSPAGALIRLEEQVKGVDGKIDHLKSEMEQRFAAVEQRFVGVDQRFAALHSEMDRLRLDMDRRFTLVQWAIALIYPFLLVILGKLF